LGNKIYFSLSQIVLEKSLRVSLSQNIQFSLGDIINFGTVDSQKFGGISNGLIYLIATPISTVIGLAYLYNLLGFAIFPPLVVIILLMWLNFVIVKKGIGFQKEYMKIKGVRLTKTDEVFSNIRFVKSNGLESFFCEKINETRATELYWLKYINYRVIDSITNAGFSSSVMLVLLFVCYVFMGNTLNVATIFTTMSVLRTFQDSLSFLPTIFASFFDLLVSSERLTNYLASDERQRADNKYTKEGEYDVILENATFYWQINAKDESKNLKASSHNAHITKKKIEDFIEPLISTNKSDSFKSSQVFAFELVDLNISIKKGELVAVIGKSGSGKTSLIMSILNELQFPKESNIKFAVNGNIALVTQKPWIRNDTLMENILFGKAYNEEEYKRALKLSSLEEDLEILPLKDNTIIGDKGINVSGGQKVRIAIARALYQDSELMIMDDPLSALDINVGDAVFKQAILNNTKSRTRIIVTHNISYLKYFDKIVFLDKGRIQYFGDYENLIVLDAFIELKTILEETSLFQSNSQTKVNQEEIHETNEYKEEDESMEIETENESSKIGSEDNLLNHTAHEEVTRMNLDTEMKEKGKVNLALVLSYLKLGRFLYLIVPIIGAIVFMILTSLKYFFYKQQGSMNPAVFDKFHFLKVSLAIEIGLVIIGTLRGVFTLFFGLSVSFKLNTLIVFRLIHASVNNFFNKNPVGKILNRLSTDVETIDRSIPIMMTFFMNISANILLNLILIVVLSSPFLLLFLVLYFYIVLKLQRKFKKSYVEMTRIN
jgi:ATP-binding cassette subfamily C (CFTR/MRP) protein 10